MPSRAELKKDADEPVSRFQLAVVIAVVCVMLVVTVLVNTGNQAPARPRPEVRPAPGPRAASLAEVHMVTTETIMEKLAELLGGLQEVQGSISNLDAAQAGMKAELSTKVTPLAKVLRKVLHKVGTVADAQKELTTEVGTVAHAQAKLSKKVGNSDTNGTKVGWPSERLDKILSGLLSTEAFTTMRKEDATAKMKRSKEKISRPPPTISMELLKAISAWSHVDLQPYNAINVALEAALADQGQLEGNTGAVTMQRQVYVALAQMPQVKHICEIGFNAGHSTALWLLANPTANVTMFDLWEHPYSAVAEKWLRGDTATTLGLKHVNKRLEVIKGSSLDTVPHYTRTRPHPKCDVISVDGGHAHEIAVKDLHHMKMLANPRENVLLLDDTNCDAFYCVDKARDLHRTLGNIQLLFGLEENVGGMGNAAKRGVSVLRYVF